MARQARTAPHTAPQVARTPGPRALPARSAPAPQLLPHLARVGQGTQRTEAVLEMQRLHGNAAVARWAQQQPGSNQSHGGSAAEAARILGDAGMILQASGFMAASAAGQAQYTALLDQTPSQYRYMLWCFWSAASGRDTSTGRETRLQGKARQVRLQEGLQIANPLLQQLKKQPAGAAQAERLFLQAYHTVEGTIYDEQAAQLVNTLSANPNQARVAAPRANETPDLDTFKQSGDLLSTSDKLKGVLDTWIRPLAVTYTRTMGPTIGPVVRNVLSKFAAGAGVNALQQMPLVQAVYYLRGMLNTADAIYRVATQPNKKSGAVNTADLLNQVTRLLEGVTVAILGSIAVIARIAGNTRVCSAAMALGTSSLQWLSWIGGVLQFVTGAAMVLAPDVKPGQTAEGLKNMALGFAGALPLLNRFGLLSRLGPGLRAGPGFGGPLTAAIYITAITWEWMGGKVAKMEANMVVSGMQGAYGTLKKIATELFPLANRLAIAQEQIAILASKSAKPEEAALLHGLEDISNQVTAQLRDLLTQALKRTTEWQNRPALNEPGGFPALVKRFKPLQEQLSAANDPQTTLTLTFALLDTIEQAFLEWDAVYREELKLPQTPLQKAKPY